MRIRIADRKRFSKFMSIVFSVIFVVCVLCWGTGAFADLENTTKEVVVMPGDTLWSIAKNELPGDDVRSSICKIRDKNALKTSEIHTGDILIIPLT